MQLGCIPSNIQFTDGSNPQAGTLTSWYWDFGDGTNSNQQNPQHTFNAAGYYTVSLKTTNSQGCQSTLTAPRYIRIVSGITADFSFSIPATCRPPYNINFTNLSSGPGAMSYQWNLGNSTTSTQNNPTTSYNSPGTYTVTLNGTSQFGCSGNVQKTITITGAGTTITSPDTVCINSPITFQNTSSPGPITAKWDFGNGTTSQNINGTATYASSGIYTVKLTNKYAECSDSAIKNIVVPNKPVVNFNATNTIGCKPPLTVNFQDLSPDAQQWNWDFGDGSSSTLQNPSHTYTAEGSYNVTLTITDKTGCQNSITQTSIVRIIKPTISFANVPAKLCEGNTFTPVVNVDAIDGIQTWSWDFGDGFTSTAANPSHAYAATGNYTLTLTITTVGGCTETVQALNGVKVGKQPASVNFSAVPVDVCALQPVNFTDLSVSSTAPSTIGEWVWNFGDGSNSPDQNPTHKYSDTGTFVVTLAVYDHGCLSTAIASRTIHVKPPIADFDHQVNCSNKTQVIFTNKSIVNPVYGPVTYSWDFGDGSPTDATADPVHNYPTLGTYKVTLTVNNGSCSNTIEYTIKLVGESATFTISNYDVCTYAAVSLQATGNAANITAYEWDLGSGFNTGSRSFTNYFSSPGSYTVSLRITDINGCQDTKTDSKPVLVHGPIANFTANNTGACKNSTITFIDHSTTSSGNLTKWTFDFGDGNTQTYPPPTTFSHQYTDTGTFTVTMFIEDSKGCTNSYVLPTSIVITRPIAKFTPQYATICPGTDDLFSDSSQGKQLSWLWNFGDGNTSNLQSPIHQYTGADNTYTVKLIITDTVNCRDSISQVITVKAPKPAFTSKDTSSICPPMETQFTFNGKDYQSFYWDFGDSTTSTLTNPSHFYNDYGNYTPKLYLIGYGGCIDSASSGVHLYNPYTNTTLNYTPLTSCNSLTVDFNVTVPPSTKFTFSFGDGTFDNSNVTAFQHFYSQPGSYGPSLLLTDSLNCQVNVGGASPVLVIGAIPFFSPDKKTFCDTGTVAFTNYTIGNDPVVSRTWDFGDGNTSTALNPTHKYLQSGTFVVSQNVTTQTGCANTITDTIRVYSTPNARIVGDSIVCINELLPLQGVLYIPDSVTTWTWDFGNGSTSAISNPATRYNTVGNYTIKLETANKLGCKAFTTHDVTVKPDPVIAVANESLIIVSAGVTLPVTYSPNVVNWTWTPASGLSCTDCPNPFATPKVTQKYTVKAVDQYGCTSSAEVLVTVVCNENNYFVPNTFSPNGDGVNDVFYPRGKGLARISSMKIFNRWGNIVFEKRDFNANDPSAGWNGTYNGKPANSDTYVYIVEFICDNAAIIPFKGNVTLIR
ncbi:MAG: PKD domain-containing protein [Chitinophagaceae bacterium]